MTREWVRYQHYPARSHDREPDGSRWMALLSLILVLALIG